jgi:hypothetical protein
VTKGKTVMKINEKNFEIYRKKRELKVRPDFGKSESFAQIVENEVKKKCEIEPVKTGIELCGSIPKEREKNIPRSCRCVPLIKGIREGVDVGFAVVEKT